MCQLQPFNEISNKWFTVVEGRPSYTNEFYLQMARLHSQRGLMGKLSKSVHMFRQTCATQTLEPYTNAEARRLFLEILSFHSKSFPEDADMEDLSFLFCGPLVNLWAWQSRACAPRRSRSRGFWSCQRAYGLPPATRRWSRMRSSASAMTF